MYVVTIQKKDGQPQQLPIQKPELSIGRIKDNDIVLPEPNVSKRHAKIVQKEGHFIVYDLQSTNRTFVNGKAIPSSAPKMLGKQDHVIIGNYRLSIEEKAPQQAPQAHIPPGIPPQPIRQGRTAPPPGPQQMTGGPSLGTPPPVGLPKQNPPAIHPPRMPPQAPAVRQAQWQRVDAPSGPSYQYLAIPHGWLLCSPQGAFVFIADPQHTHPPA